MSQDARPPSIQSLALHSSLSNRPRRRSSVVRFVHHLPDGSLDVAPALAPIHELRHDGLVAFDSLAHHAGTSSTSVKYSQQRRPDHLQLLAHHQSRSLTRPFFSPSDMAAAASAVPDSGPDSPPGLSSSRSSNKSSSLTSSRSHRDDAEDLSNFEDISLAEGARDLAPPPSLPLPHHQPQQQYPLQQPPAPRPPLRHSQTSYGPRTVRSASNLRDSANGLRASVTLNNHVRSVGQRSPTAPIGLSPTQAGFPFRKPRSSYPQAKQRYPRGPPPAPRIARTQSELVLPVRPRRSPSQSRPRKTADQLEAECDDGDDDELPEDCFIDNVPISPRSQTDLPSTLAVSPQLESPSVESPLARPRSWDEAMSDLSAEARDLTLELERHAASKTRRNSADSITAPSTPAKPLANGKPSTTPPPVQRGGLMIDPLPASQEKEKHLARTRPAWLPPKNPKEEKKHLKEYQSMMNKFYESEKRKSADAEKAAMSSKRNSKDAEAALRTWRAILGDWDAEIHKKEARELWWQGVPPALRSQVWSRAIGNDLHLNTASFRAALSRARSAEERLSSADREKAGAQARGHSRNHSAAESRQDQRARRSLQALDEDIAHGAFPSMELFQEGQDRHRVLRDLLLAYAAYREDTGHVRGTAGIAALLLLQYLPAQSGPPPASARNSRVDDKSTGPPSPVASRRASQNTEKPLPTVPETAAAAEALATANDKPSAAEEAATASAFVLFANLVNRPLSLALCLNDATAKTRTFNHIRKALRAKLPHLEEHLTQLIAHGGLTWDEVATPVCRSLTTSHLSVSDAARAWDILVFEGDGVVVRAAVGVLARLEPELYTDAPSVAQALSGYTDVTDDARARLPELGDDWVAWVRWAGREEGDMPLRRR